MIRILILAFLVISCGGSDNGDQPYSVGAGFTSFVASDPYVVGATFFHDQNRNGVFDEGELVSPPTDINGRAAFSTVVPEGDEIVQLTGGVMEGFNYNGKLKGISKGGYEVNLSPMTTLKANGFSSQEVVGLFNSAGIPITEDQLDKNPMADPKLLVASMALGQGLMANPKGFDLSPADVAVEGTTTKMNYSYAQQLLAQSAVVYKELVKPTVDPQVMGYYSKITSSFQNFMNLNGADQFVAANGSPTDAIHKALHEINHEIENSQSPYEPINLALNFGNFSAEVLKSSWFTEASYDVIGIDFINISTRQVNNTLDKYPFPPKQVRVNFYPGRVGPTEMKAPSELNFERTWTFDPQTGMVNYQGDLSQQDGDYVQNVQMVDGLPISSINETNYSTLRGTAIKNPSDEVTPTNLRLIGDGTVIFSYLGVDWGPDPTNRAEWITNTSRTNNCIMGNVPVEDCQQQVTHLYNSQRENGNIKTFAALTHASERGLMLNRDASFKFSIRPTPIGSDESLPPTEYTVSKIEMEEASLAKIFCNNPNGSMAIKTDSEENNRPPLEDSSAISFFVGYQTVPTDYKVYAINQISVKAGDNPEVTCSTKGTSSFFKDNIMIIKLSCPAHFPAAEYLFIDLASRVGLVATSEKEWIENNVLKFKYRDFKVVSLKDVYQPIVVTPTNREERFHHHPFDLNETACNEPH